jgi:5-methylcytosine-specific restriction endonuclease McrA
MAVNEAKLKEYVNKVYRGGLKRYKEEQKKDKSYSWEVFYGEETKARKKPRVAPSSPQGKEVVKACRGKCVTCPKKYLEDPDDFQIHHVNGDRSYTVTSNLVLICHSCHKKIHDSASAKLRDYINSHKPPQEGPQYPFSIPTFNPPKFPRI